MTTATITYTDYLNYIATTNGMVAPYSEKQFSRMDSMQKHLLGMTVRKALASR